MRRILIVDDKAENLYLLRALLQGHSYEVDEARHGAEALVKARQNPPHLLVSDLLMPVMDGYTLLQQWKTDERLKQIPFVVYTATYTEPKDERLALDLGADAFIVKPTEPDVFMARLQEVLARQANGTLSPSKFPPGKEEVLLKQYNEVLIRRLEVKMEELERTNRELERDIAERKGAEAALRDAESLYHSLVEHLPQRVFRKDREGRFTYMNQPFCDLLGKTPDAVLGRTDYDFFPQALAEKYRQDDERVMRTQEVFQTVQENEPTQKSKTVVQVLKIPVRNASGEIIGIQGIFTDITGQRELEAKFLRAQRLESVGSLASGIAHDLNNVLAPIPMCVRLLRMNPHAEEHQKMLGMIDSSVQRAVEIVKQLLGFGRGDEERQEPLQPRHLVRDMGRIAHETFPRGIAIHEKVPHDLWLVKGNATQLFQALLNLCVNARDAMPAGGTLTLTGENILVDEQFASQHPETKTGPYVRIQVIDTGCGIPPEIRDRIFEAFFTTKGQDKGTGLGLTTTFGIVKSHGGLILVDSEIKRGTRFEIYLPATPDSTAKPAVAPPVSLSVSHGGGELILVVDDEANIRQATERTLRQQGYEVLTAADGVEATGIYARHLDRVAVILTDLMMPRMDGVSLCRVVRTLNPAARIIVSTGVGKGQDSQTALAALAELKIDHNLFKPYTGDTLLRAVRAILET